MITKWAVSNFKSIVKETPLDLAPLTIFAGPNSSGRSTVLQSLLLVSQTLSHKVGSRSVVLNGALTRLGEFDDLRSYGGENDQARDTRTTASVLGATEDLKSGEAQQLMNHPLPYWVERMTVSYLKAHGGYAERKTKRWNLTWPDGDVYENVVFTGKEAERLPGALHLTLEDPSVRRLAMRLPCFVPGQPVPIVPMSDLSEEVQGSGPCRESRLPPWTGTVKGSCLSSWQTTARSTRRRPDTCGTNSSRQA